MKTKENLAPTNPLVNALLTDMYQLSMAYGYWKNKMHNKKVVFDLFFRKTPFAGEFAVFAGLQEALRYVATWKLTPEHIEYIKTKVMPGKERGFYMWLANLDCSKVKIYGPPEGTLVFPKMPLMRVEGPMGIVQLLETTLLNQINFATLMATNAARFRLAAGSKKSLLEFGLRRAQGADGAITASRSAYIGGFNGTSNVLAGFLYDIPVAGTHAHSFVTAFTGVDDLKSRVIKSADGKRKIDIWDAAKAVLKKLEYKGTNDGELAAFCAYAQAFPRGFLALVDTYDTLGSGVPNFIAVAMVLIDLGYGPVGIRLDSGDLAYLSKVARDMFLFAGSAYGKDLSHLKITASNDIEEGIIYSLQAQGAQIDSMGIGTHLVTCKAQPALGGVYKLVMVDGTPRIKISEDAIKMTIPGAKKTYRIYTAGVKNPVVDVLLDVTEEAPQIGRKFFLHNVKKPEQKSFVIPERVEELNVLQWDGVSITEAPDIHKIRENVLAKLAEIREDHIRPVNPTPYKVAMSPKVYRTLMRVMRKEMMVKQIAA